MPIKPVVDRELAMRVREMYEEVDSRGRRVHSYRSIARDLGLHETTVMRVVMGDGPYKDLPPAGWQPSKEEIEASAAKLMAMLEESKKPAPQYEELSPEVQERLKGYGYGKKE